MNWFTRAWESFLGHRRVKASINFLKGFDLDDTQITKIVDTVVAVKDANMPGLEKAKVVENLIKDEHHVWESPLAKEILEYLSVIVKVAWLVAKLSGRI